MNYEIHILGRRHIVRGVQLTYEGILIGGKWRLQVMSVLVVCNLFAIFRLFYGSPVVVCVYIRF